MCFNSSKSKSENKTEVTDTRQGVQATNGTATALKTETGSFGDIKIGSDDVAQFAIESSTNALTETTDFLETAYTQILNLADNSLQRADKNVQAQQAQTNTLLTSQSESSEQRSFALIKTLALAGTALGAIMLAGKYKLFR